MILLTMAIIVSIIILSVEIPVYLRMRDEIDFMVIIAFGLMLLASVTVLYFWRGA